MNPGVSQVGITFDDLVPQVCWLEVKITTNDDSITAFTGHLNKLAELISLGYPVCPIEATSSVLGMCLKLDK